MRSIRKCHKWYLSQKFRCNVSTDIFIHWWVYKFNLRTDFVVKANHYDEFYCLSRLLRYIQTTIFLLFIPKNGIFLFKITFIKFWKIVIQDIVIILIILLILFSLVINLLLPNIVYLSIISFRLVCRLLLWNRNISSLFLLQCMWYLADIRLATFYTCMHFISIVTCTM